jgi:hypothetical protein
LGKGNKKAKIMNKRPRPKRERNLKWLRPNIEMDCKKKRPIKKKKG